MARASDTSDGSDGRPGRGAGGDLRRDLLDAARRQLIQHGYAHLSMRAVAGRVGVTATSIYLHFENKDALVHALIEEGMERLATALESADAPGAPPSERLSRLCRTYLEFGSANPEYYEVMFLLHPAKLTRYPQEKYRRARRNIELFAETVRPFLRPGEDVRIVTHALWCLLHGAVSLRLSGRMDSHLEVERMNDEAVARALRMFGAA
jgi:AcrR family transcriptional regulator